MSDRSITPNLADMQRQWQEMAEAAAKPWQEVAEVFAEPWRELAESFSSNTSFSSDDVEKVGQQAWEILTSSVTALAEQQQHIAEAIFDAMRTGAEEMQKVMEPLVEQLTSFGQRVTGGSGGSDGGGAASAAAAAATAPAAKATKAAKARKSPAAKKAPAAKKTSKATKAAKR